MYTLCRFVFNRLRMITDTSIPDQMISLLTEIKNDISLLRYVIATVFTLLTGIRSHFIHLFIIRTFAIQLGFSNSGTRYSAVRLYNNKSKHRIKYKILLNKVHLYFIKGILWDRRWIAPSIGIFFPTDANFVFRNAFLIMKLSNPPSFRAIRLKW